MFPVYEYPVTVTEKHLWSFAGCPLLPSLCGSGSNDAVAIRNLRTQLGHTLEDYVASGAPIPVPELGSRASYGDGMIVHWEPLTLAATAKVMLWNALHTKGITPAALWEALAATEKQVTALFDMHTEEFPELLSKAFALAGLRLSLTMELVPL